MRADAGGDGRASRAWHSSGGTRPPHRIADHGLHGAEAPSAHDAPPQDAGASHGQRAALEAGPPAAKHAAHAGGAASQPADGAAPHGPAEWIAPHLGPPPHNLYWLEPWRAACELGATLAAWPLLHAIAPHGDGHPVLVLPGLVTDDASTLPLRLHLSGLGHDMHGWGLGWNLGPRRGLVDSLRRLVESLHDEAGHRRVSLIGWSLGGVYARRLADERPDLVRSVVTLGTPLAGGAANRVDPVYRWLAGEPKVDAQTARMAPIVPPVPSTSIYSRSDGVVAWRSSVQRAGPSAENIEVMCSHMGLGAHPAVLHAVADRLAQPEGAWQPFDRRGWRALVYLDPDRP